MTYWVGVQGQVKLVKKTLNNPSYEVNHREPQSQIKKYVFIRN